MSDQFKKETRYMDIDIEIQIYMKGRFIESPFVEDKDVYTKTQEN